MPKLIPPLKPLPLRRRGRAAFGGDVPDLMLGPVRIGLASRDGVFEGLGSVHFDGVPLRSPRRPMFVDLRTPEGHRLNRYRLVSRTPEGAGCRIVLRPSVVAEAAAPMEWMLHEVHPRLVTSDWTAAPKPAADTTLDLLLQPVSRRFGAHEAVGFSYQYRFISESLAIYKMVDRGTWEPVGCAVGAAVWMRGIVPAIAPITCVEQAYSTEWYLPSAGNPNVYQFFPLQTHLQGFTFTTSEHGVLITWATRPAHVRTLLQKPAGVNEIEHWHEHCGDLAGTFETSPMEVLFIPGRFGRSDCINLYHDVRECVWASLHEQAGLRRERVTTFGFIEQWDRADLDHYRRAGLPKLVEAGVKTIGLANHFRNNMNVLGVSNMCCTLDLRVADSVGEDRLRGFCGAAAKSGVSVEMWGNTALSTLGMLLDRNGRDGPADDEATAGFRDLKQARQPFVRGPNGAIDADHYAPSFLVLNLRDPTVRQWWLDRWGDAYERLGLRCIFLDSSFNLSSDKFHWNANPTPVPGRGATIDQDGVFGHARPTPGPRGAVQSQYCAHLDLVRDMQQRGYHYSAEDCGVFGVSRCGPGIATRLDNLFLWADAITQFDAPAIRAAGGDPDEVFFRGLAYRLMWMICWDPKADRLTFRQSGWRSPGDEPSTDQLRLIRLYDQIEADMIHARVLEDESAVIYRGRAGDPASASIVWAFRPVLLQLDAPARVTDLLAGTTVATGAPQLQALRVYRISPAT